MATSKRKNLPLIKYTSRDFESIKGDLLDYRQRYYPNTSRDQNEAGFDDMMFDTVAYVGDILSFYLDYAVNESFLDTAVEFNSVLKIGKPLGFKLRPNPSSVGIETFFIIVPANATGLGPDARYIPVLKKGSELSSVSGKGFTLNEDIDFSKTTNRVVVARVNETTGVPTAYAIKASGKIISGKNVEEIIPVQSYEEFLRIELSASDIAEIISVVDSEGKEYFEVEYLSQDVVYKEVTNRNSDKFVAPKLLRPFPVPRRFVVDKTFSRTFLQFGFGSDREQSIDPLLDPSQVILDVHGKNYVVDSSFDPNRILQTNKLGIVPVNTSLRITYRTNTAENVNTGPNSVVNINNPIFEFSDLTSLNLDTVRTVMESIEGTNEASIIGDITSPTVAELKTRIYDKFGAQNRAVTLLDYKSLVFSMPPQFGAIKRVSVIQDPDSFKRNINMYILSEDSDGSFIASNQTLKENVKIWINGSKMINDTVDILDAKIVNLGIDFTVLGETESNKFEILNNAVNALRLAYTNKEEIGEPFSITKIYNTLAKTRGVVDVINVKVYKKRGGSYSNTNVNIDELISSDGRFLNTPANVVFEVKFPNNDIKGSVK